MGLLRDLRRLLVADVGVEGRDEHQRFVEMVTDASEVRLDADGTVDPHRVAGIGHQVGRLKHIVDHHRLVDVELEVALRAGEGHGGVVPENLHADHRHRLALRWVHLARHDRTSRLVFRNRDLTDPAARPRGEPADVIGDLEQGHRQAPFDGADIDEGIVGRERGELVLRRHERMAGLAGDELRRHVPKLRVGIEAGADGRAADRQFVEAREGSLDRGHPVVELRPPGRHLLAERDRRGILEVGAADLDDLGRPLLEVGKHVAQLPHRRQEAVVDHLDGGNVHRGRKGVVRRLAAIDVVVGMNRLLRAHLATGDLDGAVRDHLVGVHVRLRAAAGLEDDEREMVVELPGDHLVGGLNDELHSVGRKLPELAVGQRRRFLEDAERLLHRPAPLEAVDADLEVVAGAFRLSAPVTIGGDLNGPHAVGLGARRRGGGHGECPERDGWAASGARATA